MNHVHLFLIIRNKEYVIQKGSLLRGIESEGNTMRK